MTDIKEMFAAVEAAALAAWLASVLEQESNPAPS